MNKPIMTTRKKADDGKGSLWVSLGSAVVGATLGALVVGNATTYLVAESGACRNTPPSGSKPYIDMRDRAAFYAGVAGAGAGVAGAIMSPIVGIPAFLIATPIAAWSGATATCDPSPQ